MTYILTATAPTAGVASWAAQSNLTPLVLSSAATATTASTDETTFNSGYSFAANTLAVGDVIRFRMLGTITAAAGKDLVTMRVRLGGVAGALLAASVGMGNGTLETTNMDGWFRVSSIGATGSIAVGGVTFTRQTGTTSTSGVTTTYGDNAITIDTTSALSLVATYESDTIGTELSMAAFAVWVEAVPS